PTLSLSLFFFTAPAPTQIYTLSLHDALPISLSRDIRELGLAKVAAPDGGSHYAPPPEAGAAIRPHLGQLLPAVLVSVDGVGPLRSEEHTSELQSRSDLVCRLLLEKKKQKKNT